jgi:serine/threonine-protein kinase
MSGSHAEDLALIDPWADTRSATDSLPTTRPERPRAARVAVPVEQAPAPPEVDDPDAAVCPACRRPPRAGEAFCPEHGLFAVERDAVQAWEAAPLLGQVLERRYALVRYLGGNMGAVYEGIDLRLQRRVAVKLDRRGATCDGAHDRFVREAHAIASLTSHHTVTVFDYGMARTPFGPAPYLVMEMVPGESLAARIGRGPVPYAEIADIVEHVCRSLSEAHGRGIVHRDVKPANILLATEPDGRPLVKLIDFGIARVGGPGGTQWGMLLGTPNYMAPEQRRIYDPGPIDGRADIYALGVVVCEMLTGQMPFHRFDSLSGREWSTGGDREPLPDVPAPIERVLRKALAHDPDRRYRSAAAFAEAFRAAVADVEARAAAAVTAQPEGRRHPWRTAAVAASVIAAAVAASVGTWLPPPDVPVTPSPASQASGAELPVTVVPVQETVPVPSTASDDV